MSMPQFAVETDSIRVLIIGRPATEFGEILAGLNQQIGAEAPTMTHTVDQLKAPGSQDCFDLVIVLQGWPEQFPLAEVRYLLDRFTLARLIVCFGAWCDSDARTRNVWPLSCRVCVSNAPARIRNELRVFQGDKTPLPLTSSRDDIFEFDSAPRTPRSENARRIALRTPDPEIRFWLTAMLESFGQTVVSNSTIATASDLMIWDVDPWTAETVGAIEQFVDQHPGLPALALAGFLRPDQWSRLKARGVTATISKLASTDEMRRVITSALSGAPSSHAAGRRSLKE